MREGDITFFRRNFLNHSTGEIHWEIFVVSETFCHGNKNMKKTGGNAKFCQTIFVSIYRESALGTLRCFTKYLVARILHGWSRGISRVSVAIFLYQSFEIFHRELFSASRKLWLRKVCMDEWRGFHIFPSSFFCLTIPKNFIGNTSSFQKFPVAKTFFGCEGGYHVFSWKNLSITVPESFIGNASWFEKVSGIWRNKWTRRGVSQSSVKTLVSCYRKDFWEVFGVSKKFWQQKNCMDERRGYQVFRLIFIVSPYRKLFLGTLRCFQNFLAAKSLFGWEKGISRFSVEKFWITVPENFIGKSSWFQTLSILGRNVWTIRG